MEVPPASDGLSPEPYRASGSARPPLGVLTVIATVAPGLVVFVLPALGMISRNQEFFRGDLSAGRDLYLSGLLMILVGFALWATSGWRSGRFLWICYLFVTPGWLVYTVAGAWDRAVAGIVVVLSILAVAWAIHRRDRHGWVTTVGLLSVLLLLSSIVTTVLGVENASMGDGAVQHADPPVSNTAGETVARLPNIYHLVLDEFQTEMFELALDDDLRHSLSGFNFYPNARTNYGRTEMAMASMVGPSDYEYETTPKEFVDTSFRGPQSSFQELRRLGYRTTGYSHLPSLYGTPSPFDNGLLFRDYVELEESPDYTGLANSLWLYTHTPGGFADRLLPEDHYAQLSGDNLLPADAPVISVLAFKKFIGREHELPSSGRYTLIHLILPHYPYVMTADCRYTEGEQTSPSQQAACATGLIVDLVEELKDLDRFESSLIVVHGDHGARFELTGDELHQLPEDHASEEWNDARSRSLLLIKPVGVDDEEPLAASEYPALLTDVMPTLFDSIGAPLVFGDERVSLLVEQLPARPKRYYHFYDKGADGLPDGELMRYLIEGSDIRYDGIVELPSD